MGEKKQSVKADRNRKGAQNQNYIAGKRAEVNRAKRATKVKREAAKKAAKPMKVARGTARAILRGKRGLG